MLYNAILKGEIKFMKNEIKYSVLVFSVIIFAATYFDAQDNSLPTLQGDAAVEKLKQNGQYDSLMEAVKATRNQDGFADFPSSENAVGQTAKLIASDGSNGDELGSGVAISGNTAVAGAWSHDVGANQTQGAAWVFVRNGTTWTQQQKLTASDGAAMDGFGITVAIDGDTIIVGAWHDGVGTNFNQGSAYVFVRSGTTWTEQQRLIAPDGTPGAEFGHSVAIDGDTVIVGAYQATVGGMGDAGAAYVFVRSGTVWTQQQKLTASDAASSDHFSNVAIDGETALVGAGSDDVGGNLDQGSAYVFVRSGTVWTQQQKLAASDGAQNDFFGGGRQHVAIDGNTVVVGATYDDVGSNLEQGSAYVFVRSGTTWTEQQHLVASDGSTSRAFGTVAIDGDTIIVGAPNAIVGLYPAVGAGYIFTRSGTTWTERQVIIASDGAERDNFGNSVAIDGNKIFIGSPSADIGMQSTQGAAYVFIARVSVSGRITTAGGSGVPKANVQMTLANGSTLNTVSTSFGYYRFDGVEADQTATVSVFSKRFSFTPQMVEVNGNLTNVDFIAQ
jgi:hypothetical protein